MLGLAQQQVDIPAPIRQAHDPDALVRWRAVAALQWVNTPETVDLMVTALQDHDIHVRKTAARALGWYGDHRAIAHLIPLLRDPYCHVSAAEALGRLPDQTSLAALIAARVGKPAVSSDALNRAIIAHGSMAIDPLAKLLQDRDPRLREWAVEMLGWIPDPRVIPLISATLRDADRNVRSRAGNSLGYHADPRAVTALITAYNAEKDELERISFLVDLNCQHSPRALTFIIAALRNQSSANVARVILGNWGPEGYDQLIVAVRDKNSALRDAAADALARIADPRAIPALATALAQEDRTESGIYQALVSFGPRVCPAVFPRLKEPSTRTVALRILALCRDPRAYQLLMHDLRTQDTHQGWDDETCTTLGMLGDRRAVPVLLALMKKPSAWGHTAVIEALGCLRDARAVPALIGALKANNEDERAAACEALGDIGDARAIALLKMKLTSRSPAVRKAAVSALCASKDPRVIPVLKDLLHSPDSDTRSSAVYALIRQGNKALEILLDAVRDQQTPERVDIVSFLMKMRDPRVVEELKALTRDTDPNVRFYAVMGVSDFAPGEAVPLLLDLAATMEIEEGDEGKEQILVNALVRSKDAHTADALLAMLNDTHSQRQRIAVLTLAALKEPRAIPRLLELAEGAPNSYLRADAITALGEIADPRAVPVLLSCLSEDPPGDSQPDLRTIAARALGKCRDPHAVEPLIFCLREPTICDAVATALGMIGDQRAVAPLQAIQYNREFSLMNWADRGWSISIVGALAALGDAQATERLLTAVTREQGGDRRERALRLLSTLDDPRVNLVCIYALTDHFSPVREEAARLLGARHAREAIPFLITALHDSYPSQAAHDALKVITGQDSGEDAAAWRAWWKKQTKVEGD